MEEGRFLVTFHIFQVGRQAGSPTFCLSRAVVKFGKFEDKASALRLGQEEFLKIPFAFRMEVRDLENNVLLISCHNHLSESSFEHTLSTDAALMNGEEIDFASPKNRQQKAAARSHLKLLPSL